MEEHVFVVALEASGEVTPAQPEDDAVVLEEPEDDAVEPEEAEQ
jgi:hypothetical protein